MDNQLGCVSVHPLRWSTSSKTVSIKLSNGEVSKGNGKFCDWADKEFTRGFLRFLCRYMGKNSDSGKRLKQTLQLTIRCKAGEKQASLVLELLFVLQSHCGKCRLMTGTTRLTPRDVDVTISYLLLTGSSEWMWVNEIHSGECQMDKPGKVHQISFRWSISVSVTVLICEGLGPFHLL